MYEPAPWDRRAAAWLVDVAAVVTPFVLIMVVGGANSLGLAVGAMVPVRVWQWWTLGRSGWTWGQRLMGVRTVDQDDGGPIGLPRALTRSLVVAAGGLALLVGALVVLASPLIGSNGRRQGWHDAAARALVISVPIDPRSPITAVFRPSVFPAASLSPKRHGRQETVLPYGLMPELEHTRPVGERSQVPWDDDTYQPAAVRLEMSDGSQYSVLSVALIGRNPIVKPGEVAIRVPDRARSVSRTHMRLSVSSGVIWVQDLGSTNGSYVRLPDGHVESLPTKHAAQIPYGSRVAVGDTWFDLVGASDETLLSPDTSNR